MKLRFGLAISCTLIGGMLPACAMDSAESHPAVFEENFQDGSSRWKTTDAESWEIYREGENQSFGNNKRISNYQPKFRSPHNIALINDLEFDSFVMTFKVKSTNDTGAHRDCCVFFGYQDPDHFYYVHLGAKPDPASGQVMIVDGAARRPLTQNEKTVPWDDKWHEVKLVRNAGSGEIAIYFDDMEHPHMKVSDSTFGKGKVGIGSFDDMNVFDDIRIFSLGPKAASVPVP